MKLVQNKNGVYTSNIQRSSSHVYSDLHPSPSTRNENFYLDLVGDDNEQSSKTGSDDIESNIHEKSSSCTLRHIVIFIFAVLLCLSLLSGVAYIVSKNANKDLPQHNRDRDTGPQTILSLETLTRYPDVRSWCQKGWSRLGTKCIKSFEEHKTWYQAYDYCRSIGSDLLSLHNLTETNSINSTIVQGQHYWIGLYEKNGSFLWSDGSVFDFEFWVTGEPNNANKQEHCVEIKSKSRWNDASCYLSQKFICQKHITTSCVTGNWHLFGRSCYMFGSSTATWYEAKESCKSLGSDLVVIETNSERQFILSQRPNNDQWIGLVYNATTPNYNWINGVTVTDLPLEKRQPVEQSSCIRMVWYGNYVRSECNTKTGYVCEKVSIN